MTLTYDIRLITKWTNGRLLITNCLLIQWWWELYYLHNIIVWIMNNKETKHNLTLSTCCTPKIFLNILILLNILMFLNILIVVLGEVWESCFSELRAWLPTNPEPSDNSTLPHKCTLLIIWIMYIYIAISLLLK